MCTCGHVLLLCRVQLSCAALSCCVLPRAVFLACLALAQHGGLFSRAFLLVLRGPHTKSPAAVSITASVASFATAAAADMLPGRSQQQQVEQEAAVKSL
jgi:hypothetical protein